MKWAQLVKLASALPEVTASTWFGAPSLKVRGKGFVRLKDEDTVVFMLDSVDEQEFLMKVEPDAYFNTDQRRGMRRALPLALTRRIDGLERVPDEALRATERARHVVAVVEAPEVLRGLEGLLERRLGEPERGGEAFELASIHVTH